MRAEWYGPCGKCQAQITDADIEARQCTQCGQPLVCDFCSSPKVVAANPCEDFLDLTGIQKSTGAWLACGECQKLVDGQLWAQLEARSLVQHGDYAELVRPYVRDLHKRFRKHRKGDT